MEYGALLYDVPIRERALYNRLRKRIRGCGIPMTWSCYLIPWGARDTVLSILKEVTSEKPNIISSSVIKFDSSEEKALAQAAERGLNQIIKNTHNLMRTRLEKAEKEQVEIEERLKIVKTQKDRKTSDAELEKLRTFAADQYELAVKRAINQADKSLKEARRLAVLFAMSGQMEFAFQGFDELLKHQRDTYFAKLEAVK